MPEEVRVLQVTPTYRVQKGLPAAIVRSYKEPRYDAEAILASAPTRELVYFSKPHGQTMNDGTVKTNLHTNQTQASQLATPMSFDCYGFNARLEGVGTVAISKGNFDLVFGAAVVKVLFGEGSEWLTVPLEDVPAGISPEGLAATDNPHMGQGIAENVYRFDVGGQSIHINAGEHYSARVTFPSSLAGITGNLLLRWFMRGILYKGV